VGTANCKIIAELSKHDRYTITCMHAWPHQKRQALDCGTSQATCLQPSGCSANVPDLCAEASNTASLLAHYDSSGNSMHVLRGNVRKLVADCCCKLLQVGLMIHCCSGFLPGGNNGMPCRMGAMLNAEEGVRPLIALVQVEVPAAQCVFTSMLNSWYLVKDRHGKDIRLTQPTGHVWLSVGCTSEQGNNPCVLVASIIPAVVTLVSWQLPSFLAVSSCACR